MSDVNKPARDYLKASGAVAVTITEAEGVCSFHAGHKIDPNSVAVYWLRETEAAALVKQARHDAGRAPVGAMAEAALHGAARDQRITLTAHTVAMERGASAANKLDEFLGSMRGTGVLMQFNREYKRRRTEATANGSGFMIYKVAFGRLRLALVPLLMSGGGQPAVGQSLFEQIFR